MVGGATPFRPFDLRRSIDRSPLANRSSKGVRRERFIARLAVSVHSNFQVHVISRIDTVHLLFIIGLFCWQMVK